MISAAVRTVFRRTRLWTESGQAWYRFVVASLVLAGLGLAHFWPAAPGLDEATILLACYTAYTAAWLGVVQRLVFAGRTRRIVTVVVDQLSFAAGLYLGGAYAAPLMWMPASIAIGNGLRFGKQYTRFAVAVGAPACALAVAASPYWRAMPEIGIGVVLSVIGIPLYASALNARLAAARRRLARRAARFELASMTDSVTGLLNRYGFMSAMTERYAGNAPRAGALMLLDLDGFKAVNDVCGHAAGDMVLVDTANRLTRCFRASDRVARIGGDEFAVLLVDINDQAQVEKLAGLALASIADISIEQQPHLTLSVSIGVCMLPHPDAGDIGAMLHLADTLMYEAKKAGKNRYRISAGEPPEIQLAA